MTMKTILSTLALSAIFGLACYFSPAEPCSLADTVLSLKAQGCTLEEVITELEAVTDSECEDIEYFYNLND